MSQVIVVKQGAKRAVISAGMRGGKGETGAQGEQGLPFQVDAQGLLANRSAFDAEAVGFSYLATDTGELYFREGAAGGWSAGVAFQGPAGDSAYQAAVANGFVGTEAEWLAFLQGDTGAAGADGRGITSLTIDISGHLIVTYTDTTQADLGLVVGADGANGTNGADGADGANGRGITSMAIDEFSHLIITYTDTTTEDAGLIPGGGSGDVVGPASATDSEVALFDGATGKLIKGGGALGTAAAAATTDFATAAQGALADSAIQSSEKGAANGVATLDAGGLVPAGQLPSYVDDVLELADFASLPGTGEVGKIYVTLDDNRQYRWSGSAYTELVASPGTTDNVPEGANLYHTESRVRATLLTGLSLADSTVVAATDSVLQALGKLAARLATAFDRTNHTGEQAISTVTGLQTALDKALYAPVITESTTARVLALTDAAAYIRHTNASASTVTVAPQASVTWVADTEIHIRRAAAGNLTLTPGSGVTLNAPSGGTLVMTDAMSVTLKRVASDVWDVIGQTVAA